MPNDDLKRLVREEMARTGERYSTARARLLARRDRTASQRLDAGVTAALRGGRLRLGWSRQDAAARLGVEPLWIWLAESGTAPLPQLADRFTAAYGLDTTTAGRLRRAAAAKAAAESTRLPRSGTFDTMARTLTLELVIGEMKTVLLWYAAVDGDVIWAAETDPTSAWHNTIHPGSRLMVRGTPGAFEVAARPASPADRPRARALLSARYRQYQGLFEHAFLAELRSSQRRDMTTPQR